MIIQNIFDFVKDKCGEDNVVYVLRELNRVIARTWHTTDLPGSLFETAIAPAGEDILILPWYVEQLKGVRPYKGGLAIQLYTPRASYHDNTWLTSTLRWKVMTNTPRIREYVNIGRLTLRLKKIEPTPVTVTIVGPSDFGGRDVYEHTFNAGDKQQETVDTVRDITTLSKSRVTASDVEILDNNGNVIALLPAERLCASNKQIKIADCGCNTTDNCNIYDILYRTTPPVFTAANEAIDGILGQIVQELLAADLLAKDEKNVRRMVFHGKMADTLLNEAQIRDNEGMSMPVKLPADAHTHIFDGYL